MTHRGVDFTLPDGGLTVDTKSAVSMLEEIATSSEGLHPLASVNWPNNANALRQIAVMIGCAADEIERLRDDMKRIADHRPGTPGLTYPSLEALIESAVGIAEASLRDGEQPEKTEGK